MSPRDNEAEAGLLQLKEEWMRKKAPFYYESISAQQAKAAIDFPTRGPVWASRTELPAPTNDAIVELVLAVIKGLGDGSEKLHVPSLENVNVQWSGWRPGAQPGEPEPKISEEEKYCHLVKDSKAKIVTLYAHGGFYCTGSPATSRGITAELARLTEGKCLVLDHRLSPQHPFPTALVDAFLAYLSLLYPARGSFHEASKPKDVVFAGDSAGANLLMSLLLLIREIRNRYGGQVLFHDKKVEVPFPAGFASIGCPMDLTLSFPWNELNHKFDILRPSPPCLSEEMPACAIWPSTPPRGDIYCDVSLLCHPLVSPVASKSFSGFPPLFLAYGEEFLGHEGRFVAQRAVEEGIIVEYHYYQRLLHVFPLMYPKLPQSKHCLREMARFCDKCVNGPDELRVQSVSYFADDPGMQPVKDTFSSSEIADLDLRTVLGRMKEKQSLRRDWTGSKEKAQL